MPGWVKTRGEHERAEEFGSRPCAVPPVASPSTWCPWLAPPRRGREEAMRYYQLRIICALRDKIAESERGCPFGHRVGAASVLATAGIQPFS